MKEQKHKGENFTKRRRERKFGKEETFGYCDDLENKDFKCVAAAALNIKLPLLLLLILLLLLLSFQRYYYSFPKRIHKIEIGSNRLGGGERRKRRPRNFKGGRGRRTGLNVKECKKNV